MTPNAGFPEGAKEVSQGFEAQKVGTFIGQIELHILGRRLSYGAFPRHRPVAGRNRPRLVGGEEAVLNWALHQPV